MRGCVVGRALHPRARPKPFPVPGRSRACGSYHAHHDFRGRSFLVLGGNFFKYVFILTLVDISLLQPPQLEDEPDLDVPWSDAMKDFIALS